MSGTEATYNMTKEDIRKMESQESQAHGGTVPGDSNVSGLKSMIDSRSDRDVISERQANLPLPDQPPTASDWNSADARAVNVGSGGVESDVSYGKGSSGGLREPATADSAVRTDGEEWKTNTAPDAAVGRQQEK